MTQPTPPAKANATIVEGLTGRLPLLVGGLVFFLASTLLFRFRSLLHANADAINFDTVGTWGVAGAVILLVVAPLLHTVFHALALLIMRVPTTWHRRVIYPRVRAARPVLNRAATRILLAPLALSLLLVVLTAVRSVSAFVVLWNALNIALSVNDMWKVLGLRRFGANALVEMNRDHCRVLEQGNG